MNFATIFQKGSATYYHSSRLFPKQVRDDVTILYAFVRTADDLVDSIPQDVTGFQTFYQITQNALAGQKTTDPIISAFIELARRKRFKHAWIIAFLDAMKSDLTVTTYETFANLEKYIHGSAETVGLMMARIMDLPEESYDTAQLQGKAMQLLNFIRDIREDLELGRQYIPQADLEKFSIPNLQFSNHDSNIAIKQFSHLINYELSRYYTIQQKAEAGYRFITRRYLIPIKTAADMYKWTAQQIQNDPRRVLDYKIKPSKYRIWLTLLKNLCTL